MGAGAIWKKPDVGFGAGVRPADSLIGSFSGYDIDIDQRGKVSRDLLKKWSKINPPGDSGYHPGVESGYQGGLSKGYIKDDGSDTGWGNWKSPTTDHPNYARMNEIPTENTYTAAEIAALQIEYDNDEALRQDKLDKMSQLSQGKGGSGGGVSARTVGDAGNLDVKHISMERSKDGFPTLADFEQPLHPFLGKRRQRY